MRSLLGLITVSLLAVSVHGDACSSPNVVASSYTPDDAQVLSHIAFIAEFTLTCSNGANNVNLYADLEGNLVPVVKVQDGSNKYQVSWTKDLKHAKSGDHSVNLYDDDGYAAVKRVLERGEGASTVKPLVTIVVNYPGAYKGPWVNSEHVAAVLSFLVFYLAYSSKSALLV